MHHPCCNTELREGRGSTIVRDDVEEKDLRARAEKDKGKNIPDTQISSEICNGGGINRFGWKDFGPE